MKTEFDFTFGNYSSRVLIQDELPSLEELTRVYPGAHTLMVCDINTKSIAKKIMDVRGSVETQLLVLESGENTKTWESAEAILRSGLAAGLGRDGLFIGVGGGVISDLTAFAASIYMRGAKLCLVSTTLLGMVDAGLGGKTGIDLLGLKNLAGTFFPAGLVVLPLAALDTLPEREWKSGMAELIKTAVLDSQESFTLVNKLIELENGGRDSLVYRECLKECISRAIEYKGRIVESDPMEAAVHDESGASRALLNLGHTFGHALEAAAGLGVVSHGEAVAWGMVRACELGMALGVTPAWRAVEIKRLLRSYGYETRAPHPALPAGSQANTMMKAIMSDKKQMAGKSRFVVPTAESAQIVEVGDLEDRGLIDKILTREYKYEN
jgi:3-dehydroquinate synthase